MADTEIVDFCPVCRGAVIYDEPRQACDRRGRSTGDYADLIEGQPQAREGHPGCLVIVEPDPEESDA